jgi:hypothetical protein
MNVSAVLAELKQERNRLNLAIAALEGINGSGPRLRGKGRTMSVAGRARIVEAQRKRWAKFKRQQKRG